MAWIQVVDEQKAQGRLREIYDSVREHRGRVANVFKVQSLNPDTMKAHLDFYLSIMFGKSSLTRAQREMVAVVVSAANKCEYCVAHHSAALSRYVRDRDFVNKLGQDYRLLSVNAKEKSMLDYAIKLTKEPKSMGVDDIGRLRSAGFSDEEILTVTLVVGYFNFVNRLVQGLGVQLETEGGEGYRY